MPGKSGIQSCRLKLVVGLAIVGSLAGTGPSAFAAQSPEVEKSEPADREFDGKTIAEWIQVWDAGQFRETQQSKKALAKIGEAATPALTELIRNRHRHAGYAIQTLGEMGPAAKSSLPELLKLAGDQKVKNPEGWTWNVPIRFLLFQSFKKMPWASDQIVPVLERAGKDDQETDQIRGIAVNSLLGMGPKALPSLRIFARTGSQTVRRSAVNAIVEIEKEAGVEEIVTLQKIIDEDPFDSNVPTYLANMKHVYNLGRIHPPTQRIKELYRRELKKKADPQIAWQLATIIRNGLANSDLAWAAPTTSYRSTWNREDPDENYSTLATALEMVFANSKPESDLRNKASLSLAKLRLLQGNWEGMNEALTRVGQAPIPADLRPDLPPPPFEWGNLKKDWQPADQAMRSGKCGVEFRFLRRGKKLEGVPGVHVLVKRAPKPEPGFRSGIRVDTILYATQPLLEGPYDSFGYRGQDRNQTRYGVSNKNGLVRIEGLPKMPVLIEILVPAANFEERGHTWNLVMATPNGPRVADRREPNSVDPNKPPSVVELEEDAITRYPTMFIRSQLTSSVSDWASVGDDFELTWDSPREADVDHYDIKLSLSAPTQHPGTTAISPTFHTQTIRVKETSWPLGARGVGKLRLAPGNIYVLQIDAVGDKGVIATLPRLRLWTPWKHRETEPPLSGNGSQGPAFYNDIYFRTSANGKPLEERLPALIKNSPKMFETEYNRLGMAWLDLHKKKPNAVADLKKLAQELPAGNVVRTTAQFLLDTEASGQKLPRRLKFVGPAAE